MAASRRAILWTVAALLLALAAGAAAWRAWRPPEVPVVRIEAAPLVRTLRFSARVATDSRVEVGATVTGRVVRVRVREGDTVDAGDVLVELEDQELRAALQQAQAAERQAQARLAGLRSTGRQAAGAAVAQAEAQWRNARAELARNEQLVAQGFVSAARLDDARRALEVAAAQREAALAQARATADRGTDVEQASAQLAAARAATEAAQARLAQSRVQAPAEARVLARLVEPGQIVQPGRALLRLALRSPRELVAAVDERFLEQLEPGQPAIVAADAFPDRPFEARVARIAPAIDPQRGAVEVRLSLPESAPGFLREDMTVSVQVETGRREQALAIPLAALRGEASVLLVDDGRVAERAVRLGLRTLDAVEVQAGLASGDQVLMGADPPGPGARVQPRPTPWTPGHVPDGGQASAGNPVSEAFGR
ncbi:efflux RND transporter periplasmic adaptor subunit [Ramlibacter rhizophilus]|uniref:Efflux RND transporter periplasmic adaptor subunit n=1 Tax=Ramlibacter rhizophilus TaxID=1781167 RepID=A0A4Z0BLD7_9BURK|nr:efflux RND transporter periplasmic adaptor subunit [Ramlibacter rhizophilus]TFY99551.1 efflux RND transporter periplasmic adaptor subunit [Ramlibacter rhizophilus]